MIAGTALANGLGQVALAARVGTGIITAVESSKGAMELYENHGAQVLFHQQDKHYSPKQVEEARKHVSEAMGKPVLGMAAFGLESGLESAAKGAERFTEAKELAAKLNELKNAGKHGHDLSNGLKAAEGVAAGVAVVQQKPRISSFRKIRGRHPSPGFLHSKRFSSQSTLLTKLTN
ncbi:unnamed protein product [Sphagnum balticum]